MNLSALTRLPRIAQNQLRNLRGRHIHFTSDHGNWAIDWHVRYIAQGIEARRGKHVPVLREARGLRGQIIHCFDRYAFLRERLDRALHASNTLFLSWMHVDPEATEAELAMLRNTLPEISARTRAIVVTCETTRAALAALGADPARMPILPHGVDQGHFFPPSAQQREQARAALGIPEGAFAIGSFVKDGQGWGDGSEPKRVKGPDVFLEVIERVFRERPNLFVVLSGPARGYVKAGLEKLGVPYAHRFLKEYHDLGALYHALDLYLITSRAEGGPVSFPEAWAVGLPVVSTRVGMAADSIRHGENGMIADVNDADGLTAGVLQLIDDPTLRQQCAGRAAEAAREMSWDVIAERHHDELYALAP